ncbi:MAG: amidase family protein, partial [Hyphomicrobiaceae bacterium]
MSDLAWMSIAEASRLLSERKLSPVELTDALLARIERLDSRWHAFIRVLPERARAQARAAEAEIAAGSRRGPLHGIPVGLKDIIDVA